MNYYLRAILRYRIPNWLDISAVYKQRQGRYYLPVIGHRYVETYQIYEPTFTTIDEGQRLPDYYLLDLSLSKIIGLDFGSLVIFASASNIMDFKNVRSYRYNTDYSKRTAELYGQRVFFFGGVLQW